MNGMDIFKMFGLDLFSGIGGLSLALQEWVRPIAYCEIDPYCQGVLLSRISDGCLGKAPIWDDIRTLEARCLPRSIDIIYGGFPCQDISIAGHGKGLEGERSGLFFEIMRLAKEIKPKFLFLENVPAITTRGGLQVVRTIAEMGYDCRWCVISAASVGALHRRERWFLLAYAKHYGAFTYKIGGSIRECPASGEEPLQSSQSFGKIERASSIFTDVADSKFQGLEGYQNTRKQEITKFGNQGFDGNTDSQPSQQADSFSVTKPSEWRSWGRYSRQYWPFESREHWQETVSSMGKCSDGISNHTHRLRALGNAVVSQQAKKAFEILIGLD